MCAVGLLGGLTTLAAAQGGPGGGQGGPGGGRRMGQGGMMGGGLRLLRIPEVQQELKMTQTQIDKIDTKQQEMRDAMREVFQGGGQQMTPEERAAAMQKVQDIQAKAVADILDTTQAKRFSQIELQQQGASAWNRPAVAKQLGITAEQTTKLREVQRGNMQKMREMFTGQNFQQMTPEERKALADKMAQFRKDSDAQAVAVLTDAQRARWKEMLGTPFKMPANAMGMGMFGGGRRGGGGAGGAGGGGNPPQ